MSYQSTRHTNQLLLFTIAVLALASMSAAGQTPTQEPSSCATGSAAFQSGSSGNTVGSPFSTLMRASTGSGCSLTAVRLYADNKPVQTNPASGQSGGFNFQPISLTDGYHNLVSVAWNQDGYAFRTPDTSIFIANEDQMVYIPFLADKTTFTDSTVHFNIRTRWDGYGGQNTPTQVTHVRVYVDNLDIYDSNNPYVDFYKTLASGAHYAVAVVWNASGSHIQSSSSFFVK